MSSWAIISHPGPLLVIFDPSGVNNSRAYTALFVAKILPNRPVHSKRLRTRLCARTRVRFFWNFVFLVLFGHNLGPLAYLIFVTFFTPTHFDAWKFYTQRCVNSRQKWPRDKTEKITTAEQNYILCIKLHTVCKITHWVTLHIVCYITNITNCVLNLTHCV